MNIGHIARGYRRDGFAIVPGAFSKAECSALADTISKIDLTQCGPLDIVRVAQLSARQRAGISRVDAGDAVFIVAGDPHRNTVFANIVADPRLERMARAALGKTGGGGPVAYHFSNVTDKPPRVGPLIGWHRDFLNPLMRQSQPRFLRIMICIDGMTRTNGAIAFAPGSHHVSNETLRRNKTRKSPRWGRRTRLALCPPGSAIVFDSKVLHASGPNRSSMARRTLIVQLGMGCDRLIASHHEDWTGTSLQAIRRGRAGGAPSALCPDSSTEFLL